MEGITENSKSGNTHLTSTYPNLTIKPMSENSPENLDSEPISTSESPPRKSWGEKIKNVFKSKKTLAAGAGAAAGLAAIAGIASEVADNGDRTETPIKPTAVERTIEPTTEPSPLTEITPTPLEETPIPSPSETPATTTETPAPAETQKPKNYEIIDKGILNPEHPAYESITYENAVNVVNHFFENYPALSHPQYGNLKVEIILGGGNWYFPEEHRLVADRASANFEEKFSHEAVHSWENVLKTRQDYRDLRESLLSNPQIGRHYPSVETLMSTQYIAALAKFADESAVLTLDDLGELASNQADRSPLAGWITSEQNDPLSSYFYDASLEAKQGTFDSVAKFLEDPDVKSVIAQNKYWKFIADEIKSNPAKWENYVLKIHPQLYSQTDAQTYTKAFSSTGRLILAEKLLQNDPKMPELFTQEQLNQIISELQKRKSKADEEMVTEVISKWIYLSEKNRIEGEDTNLNYLIDLVKNAPINH